MERLLFLLERLTGHEPGGHRSVGALIKWGSDEALPSRKNGFMGRERCFGWVN
jgi:hypothetical protein